MISNLSYSPETVKLKLGCDLCDLDLWPWPFAWTLRWSLVITPENFMMIRWWEHSQKGVTDRRTEQTENTICRAAWSQLKTIGHLFYATCLSRSDLCETLTFCMDLTLSLVITPENFMMIRWWEHSQKGVTDRRTEQTENTICRAAWSQLKTIGHLFYATSSFEHHFVAIGVFKLELQSGNAQFGSNSPIFRAVWPWNLRDDIEKQ